MFTPQNVKCTVLCYGHIFMIWLAPQPIIRIRVHNNNNGDQEAQRHCDDHKGDVRHLVSIGRDQNGGWRQRGGRCESMMQVVALRRFVWKSQSYNLEIFRTRIVQTAMLSTTLELSGLEEEMVPTTSSVYNVWQHAPLGTVDSNG